MNYTYTTQILPASIKKLKGFVYEMKKQKLVDVMKLAQISGKPITNFILSDLKNIYNNLINIHKRTKEEVETAYINYVITEKRRLNRGLRYRAKGSAGQVKKYVCSLKINIRIDEIAKIDAKQKNQESNNTSDEQKKININKKEENK